MKRLLAVVLAAASLSGCGVGMTNEQIATETKFCLDQHLDPVLDKTFFGSFRIVCTPPELTMFQKLEFMTWVDRENKRIEAKNKSFEAKQKVTP